MTDTLSDVLRAVRLTGAVFFAVDASASWVAETPHQSTLGPHIMPGVEHVIDYHLVTAGACWGGLIDEPPVRLEAGDVIVFPQGDAHTMSSAPGMRGQNDLGIRSLEGNLRLPVSLSIRGGGNDRAELICGFLGCDARPFNPLLATLPRMIHIRRCGYVQWHSRSRDGNTQRVRNREIQRLVRLFGERYEDAIHARLVALGVGDFLRPHGVLRWDMPNPEPTPSTSYEFP